MNKIDNLFGTDLIRFIESTGCNSRYQLGMHKVMWSIFTGDFFIIPVYDNEYLDRATIKYITLQMGITDEAFSNMLSEYKQ